MNVWENQDYSTMVESYVRSRSSMPFPRNCLLSPCRVFASKESVGRSVGRSDFRIREGTTLGQNIPRIGRSPKQAFLYLSLARSFLHSVGSVINFLLAIRSDRRRRRRRLERAKRLRYEVRLKRRLLVDFNQDDDGPR